MKKTQLFYFTGIVLVGIFIFLIPRNVSHSETRVINLDSIAPRHLLRDYQLDIVDEHTINIYDGERFVGSIPLEEDYQHPTDLDNAIILDNQ